MNADRSSAARRPLLWAAFCFLLLASACTASDEAAGQVGSNPTTTGVKDQGQAAISEAFGKVGDTQRRIDGPEQGNGTGPDGSAPNNDSSPGKNPGSGSPGNSTTTTTGGTGGTTSTTTYGPSSLPAKGGETCAETTNTLTGKTTPGQCCPGKEDPRQCDAYDISADPVIWEPESSGPYAGKILIRYWTNSTTCTFSESSFERAFERSTSEWSRTHPKLAFVYMGSSNLLPGTHEEKVYNNVVGCDDRCTLWVACTGVMHGSKTARFYMALSTKVYDTTICNPTAGTACTNLTGEGTHFIHLQSLLAHELVHVICYAGDLFHGSTVNLTMHGNIYPGHRNQSTVGKGDALMVQACYGPAPIPHIYPD